MHDVVTVENSIFLKREEFEKDYKTLIKEFEEAVIDRDQGEALRLFGMVQVISYILNGAKFVDSQLNSMVRMINRAFKLDYEEFKEE